MKSVWDKERSKIINACMEHYYKQFDEPLQTFMRKQIKKLHVIPDEVCVNIREHIIAYVHNQYPDVFDKIFNDM